MRGWARAGVWEDRQASLEKLWTMAFRGLWRKMDLNIIKSWLHSLSISIWHASRGMVGNPETRLCTCSLGIILDLNLRLIICHQSKQIILMPQDSVSSSVS